jgi:hypothetical protein
MYKNIYILVIDLVDMKLYSAYKSYVISLLIHQSRAHRGHIQYVHLLQLFYNITSNQKKKTVHGNKYPVAEPSILPRYSWKIADLAVNNTYLNLMVLYHLTHYITYQYMMVLYHLTHYITYQYIMVLY